MVVVLCDEAEFSILIGQNASIHFRITAVLAVMMAAKQTSGPEQYVCTRTSLFSGIANIYVRYMLSIEEECNGEQFVGLCAIFGRLLVKLSSKVF